MLDAGNAFPALDIPRHMMNSINPQPTNVAQLYKPELPDSQESFVSTASSSFAAPALLSSSSNISNFTALTSPTTSNVNSSQGQPSERPVPPSPAQVRPQHSQHAPPPIDTANPPSSGNTTASPMSLDSPVLAQGSKRTADGALKDAGASLNTPAPAPNGGHKRTKSMESGSNPRIGKLSAQLKTRLSYAMTKVQNGWEKQSLEELEDMTSQRDSPVSAHGRSDGTQPSFDSPRSVDRRRRPSGVSENSDQALMSPSQSSPSEVSRSLATTPSSFWRSAPKSQMSASVDLIQVTDAAKGPVLAPPVEIDAARRKRRSSASHAPPPLLGSAQRKHHSDLSTMASPRTPTTTPRAGILRMPSQQAEKDAVDTLLFMSSPNNSGRVPHTSLDGQPHPSPLRSEVPARRVMFENHVMKKDYVADTHHLSPGQSAHYQRTAPRH